jgi:hypothetical protein
MQMVSVVSVVVGSQKLLKRHAGFHLAGELVQHRRGRPATGVLLVVPRYGKYTPVDHEIMKVDG